MEIEVPDCLIAILTTGEKENTFLNKRDFVQGFSGLTWQGTPNILSKSHMDWSGIDEVAASARKTESFFPIKFEENFFFNLIKDDNFPLERLFISDEVQLLWTKKPNRSGCLLPIFNKNNSERLPAAFPNAFVGNSGSFGTIRPPGK
ncbi:MAG: hypothetical protein Ct9H300mP23_10640 [Nitrospinota bacterium]|nr:MAG: hypothetical protein Ct9H300mP23_10640 [Nitrospinota bacterium]